MSRRRNARPLPGQRRRDLVTRSGGGGTETRSWGGPSAVPLADARTLIHSRRSTTPATAALALASQPAASLQPRATPTLLRPEPTTSSPYGRDMSCSLSGHSPHASAIYDLCSTIQKCLYFFPCCSLDLHFSKSFVAIKGGSMTFASAALRSPLSTPFLPSRTPPLTPSSSR